MTCEEVVILIPSHGLEDFPYELPESQAAGMLNAFAVAWHPRLLAGCTRLPRWEPADQPMSVHPGMLVIVPSACDGYLASSWIDTARAAGATVVHGQDQREDLLRAVLEPLAANEPLDPELVADFLAFGTVHLQQELLTREMRNYGRVDTHVLEQELPAAARSLIAGDLKAAKNSLHAAFESLLECRERYYPVECWLIDLCLVTPELADEHLSRLLLADHPVSLLAPGDVWREVLARDPQWRTRVAEGIEHRKIEVLGGSQELCEGPLSLDAVIHSLRKNRELLTKELGVTPTTWGRKRFGHGPHLPQLLKRLHYNAALHFVLDDGIYPDQEHSLIRWIGSDKSEIDAFSRIPIAADTASSMIRFAPRLAESMDFDHTAAVVFLRWPRMRNPFLDDLIRAARYQPVLGKFVTFEQFFAKSPVSGRRTVYAAGDYRSPSLTQAALRVEADPVSRYIRWWSRERAWRRANWLHHIGPFLLGEILTPDPAEDALREAHPEADAAAHQRADELLSSTQRAAIPKLLSAVSSGTVAGPGLLIVNPHSFARQVVVPFPAGLAPASHPAVKQVQIDGDQAQALVELPPCGFTWLSSERIAAPTSPGKQPLAEELVLRSDKFEVRLSPVTGGIGQILTYHRSPNRISQQLAIRFPEDKIIADPSGNPAQAVRARYTAMRMKESRVLSAGPLIGEIETLGELVDESNESVLGTYVQRTRTTHGKPIVEVSLELSLSEPIAGDPWESYAGCRFAWAHEDVVLTASLQDGAQLVSRERIESPQFIEIADDKFRTTILSPGQPYFRKTGERMLDMILVPAGETRRRFQFAVVLDDAYPVRAGLDLFSPPILIPTEQKPADVARQGWFLQLSSANVQLQRLSPGEHPDRLVLRLLETEGRESPCRVGVCRNPVAARTIDFLGDTVETLDINDGVRVELPGYGLRDVELTFKR